MVLSIEELELMRRFFLFFSLTMPLGEDELDDILPEFWLQLKHFNNFHFYNFK